MKIFLKAFFQTDEEVDDRNLFHYRACRIPFIIVPHIDHKKAADKLEETLQEWKDKPYHLIGLTDSQALVSSGNFTEIVDVAET